MDIDLWNTRPMIDSLILKAFNIYNGRINIFNQPAMLQIDWLMHPNSGKAGTSANPNIITIYPSIIARHCTNMSWFKYQIILSIMHELYHTDQVINYPRMIMDPVYRDFIENVVEMESHLYLAHNKEQIKRDFGIDDLIESNKFYDILEKDGYETGTLFKRRNYKSHFIGLILDMLYGRKSTVIEALDFIFDDPNSIITVIFNESISFTVKDGTLCMPLPQLNQIMYENFFQYNSRGALAQLRQTVGSNIWRLYIKTSVSNRLGHCYNGPLL